MLSKQLTVLDKEVAEIGKEIKQVYAKGRAA